MQHRTTKRILGGIIGLCAIHWAHASNISDSYASGDTLTAEKMNNIKTAVNSKQDLISGACAANQAIAKINPDGTVECSETASSNALTLGGVGVTGFVQSSQNCEAGTVSGFDENGKLKCTVIELPTAVTGACEAGQMITAINQNGTVSCTSGGAGSDINADRLDGFEATDFASSDQSCDSGIIKGIDNQGNIVCEDEIYFLINFGDANLSTVDGMNHIHNSAIHAVENTGDAFNTNTGIFTAPAAGAYQISGNINIEQPNNALSSTTLTVRVVAGEHKFNQVQFETSGYSNSTVNYSFSFVAKMDSGETAYVEYLLNNKPRGNGYSVTGTASTDTLGPSYISGARLY